MQTFLILLLSVLALGCSAQNAGNPAGKFHAVADYRVIRAEFVQTRHLAELDMKVVFTGEMICEKNGRLRWQVKSPVRSITVISNSILKHYDGETGKISVIRQDRFPWLEMLEKCMSDWISGDPAQLARRFELSAKDARTLRLLPKEPALKEIFKAAEIRAAARFDAVESISIEEKSGDRLEIRFRNIRKNPVLPESIWEL